MKKTVFFASVLFAALSFQSSSYAATANTKIDCNKFSKEIESSKVAALKHQKELDSLNTQIESGEKAINDFNKNCRGTSAANCNPGTYNMISTQMATLNGQRQKVQSQVLDAATKQEEATKNLRLCKSVKVHKTAL